MKNYKKRDRYSELMTNLKESIKSEFYYEAIFIIYAILEDRTESILRHANVDTVKEDNKKLVLAEKLTKIRNMTIFKEKYVKKHLTNDLISQIHTWKNKRNILIHDLVNAAYDNEDIKILALEGYEIVKNLNNKSTLINKYNDKINQS